LQVIETPT